MTEGQYRQRYERNLKNIESVFVGKYNDVLDKAFHAAANLVENGSRSDAQNTAVKYKFDLAKILVLNYNASADAFGRLSDESIKGKKHSVIQYLKKEKLNDDFWAGMNKWIKTQTALSISGITATTRRIIRNIVSHGIDKGLSNGEIAANIREAIIINRHRSMLIAVTETHNASAFATKTMVGTFNFKKEKKWMNAGDERVRQAHKDVTSSWIDEDDTFSVGGQQLDHPGASNANAANACNCRCGIMYRRKGR